LLTGTWGTTYYVRTDGGSATQCNGKADAAYPGSGTNQNCAWSNPMIALPPAPGTARIAGGDLLIVDAGQYKIGYGVPGAESCTTADPGSCTMVPLPSGPDAAHPTRLFGQGYDSACPAAPQLWGTERLTTVLDLTGTNNAEVACFEITDHMNCVDNYATSSLACNRSSYPYGDWAQSGISASASSNVWLQDLNVHGLADNGVTAGGLNNWTLQNVRIAANGWAGWEGDIGAGSANTGTMSWKGVVVEWNGCSETYPGNQPTGCWGQSVGGYGDGVGTASTGGNWVIQESIFRYNTQDGLDLLYHDQGGTITLDRVWAEGNAGDQLKLKGNAVVTNTVVLGSCGFFNGKSFTYALEDCRANGDAVVLIPNTATDVQQLINNTIVSEGNTVVTTGGPAGSVLRMYNNIFVGLPYFLDTTTTSADTYDTTGTTTLVEGYALKQTVRNANCSTTAAICGNAGLTAASAAGLTPTLVTGSAARDSGMPVGNGVPAYDYYGNPRPAGAGVDRGAVEMQ
jgi:hypothetical protein